AGEFLTVMKGWGVAFDPGKAVGDIATARRVQFGGGPRPIVTEYVAWLGLDRSSIDERDVLFGGIDKLNLASAGFLTKAEGASTTLLPIIQSSPQAMQIAADKLQMLPDPVGLLRAYKPEGKRLVLAARVSGEAKSAFPDGPPKPPAKPAEAKPADDKTVKPAETKPADDKAKAGQAKATANAKAGAAKAEGGKEAEAALAAQPAKAHKAAGRVNAIIVADSDMLSDQFWVDVREFLGQQVAIPNAGNAAFVVNALDNL